MFNLVPLRKFIRRLAGNSEGVAYIEFAFYLPIFLLMFAGAVDLNRMVLVQQKINKVAFTLGDLITQKADNPCFYFGSKNWGAKLAKDIMQPFAWNGDYNLGVGSYARNPSQGNAIQREWSHGNAGLLPAPGSLSTLVNDARDRVIVTSVDYPWKPVTPGLKAALASLGQNAQFLTDGGSVRLQATSYMKGRISQGLSGWKRGTLSSC